MSITIKGGDVLKQTLARIAANLSTAKQVEVGWNKDATYPANHRNGGLPVAYIAAINEFGYSGNKMMNTPDGNDAPIPPRPFFRTMIATNKGHYSSDLGAALRANEFDAHAALTVLGTEIGTELKKTIIGWSSPGNSAVTIARKGFDDPLNETGEMQSTVNHWVE
jgi:hypothetical protein